MEVYLKWMVNVWDQLPKDLIIKTFKECGLTNTLDGSEDCKIYYFWSDCPINTGQQLHQQARANAEITSKRKVIQQLDVDAEEVENDDDGYNSDESLNFYQ